MVCSLPQYKKWVQAPAYCCQSPFFLMYYACCIVKNQALFISVAFIVFFSYSGFGAVPRLAAMRSRPRVLDVGMLCLTQRR